MTRWALVIVMVAVSACAPEAPYATRSLAQRTAARYVEQIARWSARDDAPAIAYALLVEARRQRWSAPATPANDECVRRIATMAPTHSEQSGVAALLVWDQLDEETKMRVCAAAAAEADRVADKPPRDAKPGQTGAAENARDLQGPVLALALQPNHPHAAQWWRAACTYAVNVFSTPGDRTSNAAIGANNVRRMVSTTNLFNDYTLENAGRFDPDCIQVCAQELGDAWITLKLGDRIHGTDWAELFEPYSLHHVADSWTNVMRTLFLPSGALTSPGGGEQIETTPAYLAFVATALNDPVAAALEARQQPQAAESAASALLHHQLRPYRETFDPNLADGVSAAKLFPEVQVWVRRNANYFVSASWGKRTLGTFTPFHHDYVGHPQTTLPLDGGILPAEIAGFESGRDVNDAVVLQLRLKSGGRCALICLPNSVVWMSPDPMRALGVETGRTVTTAQQSQTIARNEIDIPGTWMNFDNRIGCIGSSQGFRYTPAGGYNHANSAVDRLTPPPRPLAWQMISDASADETRAIAEEFFSQYADGTMRLTLRDGPRGKHYSIVAPLSAAALAGGAVTVEPLD